MPKRCSLDESLNVQKSSAHEEHTSKMCLWREGEFLQIAARFWHHRLIIHHRKCFDIDIMLLGDLEDIKEYTI